MQTTKLSKLHTLFSTYSKESHPINTHNIHPYPAKFPPHIPYLILENYADNKEVTVLDPFMGSGTTVVEGQLLGYKNMLGNDINPLSPLIVETKLHKLNDSQLVLVREFIEEISEAIRNKEEAELIDWKNIENWFKDHIRYEISVIKKYINEERYASIRYFNLITLSSIIVSVSNQDSDIRYASKDKATNNDEEHVLSKYIRQLNKYIKTNSSISDDLRPSYKLFNNNALDLIDIESDSVDMIITSPPYANTNDYFLNHKLRLLTFDLDYDSYRKNEIGSHAQFSTKNSDISKWNFDLKQMLESFNRVLKSGSSAFIVIGDTVWRKDLYKVNKMIEELLEETNFTLVDTYSYNLKDVSKSFNPLFASQDHIKEEHIIHIKKK